MAIHAHKCTFKEHPLTEPERLWLTELAQFPNGSPKSAKVKLYEQLPPDFSSDHIDPRLYFGGRPTPIGLWHVDQTNPLFRAMDQTILEIQRRIRANPALTTVTAADIAAQTELSEAEIGEALFALGNLGHFFTQAQGVTGNPRAYSNIHLTDDTSYDEYLRYTNLDELLERVYVARGRGLESSLASSERSQQPCDVPQAQGAPTGQQGERAWYGVQPEVQRAIEAGWANGMPPLASALYGRWWQLESWLRSLLYVELKANLGSAWQNALPKESEMRQQGDAEFRYMATPDAEDRLAYADASALFKITMDHWGLFSVSLPAKNVWSGRIEELRAIRNRIGHCRRPHSDDLGRLEQALRDLNGGAFAATAAFNEQARALESWTDPLVDGWVKKRHDTAVRLIDHADRQYKTTFELRCSRRPWAKVPSPNQTISGVPGCIWHAFWYVRGGQAFRLDKFWRDVECFRDLIVFVCADSPSSISVSFAAVDEPKAIADVVGYCFDAALMSLQSGPAEDYIQWLERYSELHPRVQVGTPWTSVEQAMRGVSIFAA